MPNTAKRRHVESEITQKQNKHEQANPEITCGIDEGTARNEPVHCPRGQVVAMGRGKMEMWEMRNAE
jgi:hypothetical protein